MRAPNARASRCNEEAAAVGRRAVSVVRCPIRHPERGVPVGARGPHTRGVVAVSRTCPRCSSRRAGALRAPTRGVRPTPTARPDGHHGEALGTWSRRTWVSGTAPGAWAVGGSAGGPGRRWAPAGGSRCSEGQGLCCRCHVGRVRTVRRLWRRVIGELWKWAATAGWWQRSVWPSGSGTWLHFASWSAVLVGRW